MNAIDVLCTQLTRDLLAIAKFLCYFIVCLFTLEEEEDTSMHRGFGMMSAAVPPPGVW